MLRVLIKRDLHHFPAGLSVSNFNNCNHNSESIMNTNYSKSLDQSLQDFQELLQDGSKLIIDRYKDMDEARAYGGYTPGEVEGWFKEPIPQKGMENSELLDLVKTRILDTATLNFGPNMFAYVMAGGTQVSVFAELIAASINQNVAKWHSAPIMSEIEKRVIQWGAEFIGYDLQAGGVLCSGGSAGNLTGLTVARNLFFEKYKIREKGLFGMKPFIIYGSDQVHNSIDKSVEVLGIGTANYRKIKSNHDYTLDIEALQKQIDEDIQNGFTPFCIVGNAGTVNTGAIDNLEEIAAIAAKHTMWFHVDGAYGGLAASSDIVKELYRGLDKADSVTIDFHKWLYQPLEAGCLLVKSADYLKRTFYKTAAYLSTDNHDDGRFDFNEHHFQLSRNAKALKIWMSFKAYGAENLRRMIEKDILLTKYLKEELLKTGDFEIINEPQLSALCFRYLGPQSCFKNRPGKLEELNRAIIPALENDGRVFITGTTLQNQQVIRACLINHRIQKENVDRLIAVIREVGTSLSRQIAGSELPEVLSQELV